MGKEKRLLDKKKDHDCAGCGKKKIDLNNNTITKRKELKNRKGLSKREKQILGIKKDRSKKSVEVLFVSKIVLLC